MKTLARWLLGLLGWRLLNPAERPRKAVVIGYPHTSNWDFPLTILALVALGVKPRWAGKDSLFAGWRGPLMRALGGVPVNRRERTGFVARMVEEFGRQEDFLMVIAPEGTRRRTEGWKSGFYRIAHGAGVPLVLGTLDYARKEIGFLATVAVSGDEARDMAALAECYRDRRGKHPAMASPIRLL